MKFESYYSSSKHNLYTVTAASGKRLLIECGATWKQIEKALDFKLDNVVGCLLSHEHRDHSKSAENVLMNTIDVYSSEGTFEALCIPRGHRRVKVLRDKERTVINATFSIFPFAVNHDAAESFGFVIHEIGAGEDLLFVTDTSHIKQKFGLAFDIIAICCSYDGEWLAKRESSGDINSELAKRLLNSHMEKEVTKSYIRECCCLDRCTEIHLLHMSGDNIEKEEVRAEFEKDFMVKTLIAGS